MARPEFDGAGMDGATPDSEDGNDDLDAGLIGYVQEGADDTGLLTASQNDEDTLTADATPDEHK